MLLYILFVFTFLYKYLKTKLPTHRLYKYKLSEFSLQDSFSNPGLKKNEHYPQRKTGILYILLGEGLACFGGM
jgi:hypothetical protein